MLDAIKSAGRDRDSVKLTSFFTSDAVIVIDLPANMGGRMEMGVTQYREQLSQTWSLPAEFTFDVEDESYTISKDGKSAEASSTMIEEVMMGGRVIISSRSKEEMRIVAVDGKPAISNVYAKITFNQ
ncbi:hypothetical protein [Sinobacterium caligoides]|nr:hypothetical protein [Sinobacterium caligoides]